MTAPRGGHAISHRVAAVKARLAVLPAHRVDEARTMKEAIFLELVRRRCRRLGLYVYHTHRSDRSEPGFPDLVIVGHRILYRELKTEIGKVTDAQVDVLGRLAAGGADADVWRPSDLISGRIDRELEAIVRRAALPV